MSSRTGMLVLFYLSACAPVAAGASAFAAHPLGPGAPAQSCVTNVQQNPYGRATYATAYTTCSP